MAKKGCKHLELEFDQTAMSTPPPGMEAVWLNHDGSVVFELVIAIAAIKVHCPTCDYRESLFSPVLTDGGTLVCEEGAPDSVIGYAFESNPDVNRESWKETAATMHAEKEKKKGKPQETPA